MDIGQFKPHAITADTAGAMDSTHYRGRFAPSPTGPLHLGSLVAALGSWLFARRVGGEWLVRIEDLDPPREVPGASRQQLASLHALGLHPDGPVLYQSQRDHSYRAALQQLLDHGAAFACHCSRRDLETSQGRHPLECVSSDPLRPTAIRLRVSDAPISFIDGLQGFISQCLRSDVGDIVLRRADGYWAYQLAVVVDDAAQGITDIVRGADLLDSTPRQIWLQRCLGLPTPNYLHLPLVCDDTGQKLSKSREALAITDNAPLPALLAAWRFLGQAHDLPEHGLSPEAWLEMAVAAFEPERIVRNFRASAAADSD